MVTHSHEGYKMKVTKKIQNKAEQMFYKLGKNIQFNMMDLGKISKAAESVLIAGGTDEAAESAMSNAISQYRLS